VDSCGATIDFLLSAKRDLATAQRFLTKAVGGESHPEPRELPCLLTLFAQQHGNDGLFAGFYRHPRSAILLQKQVSKASIAKIVCVSLPPSVALSKQGGYAHTLKGYFTPIWAGS
jgi:hypothetical protein